MIVTEAIIEGQPVFVILDTGAPGLVLNEKYFSPDLNGNIACMGINGSFECKSRQVSEWQWLGTTTKKTKTLVSNLSFLEDGLQIEIHALIGLSALHDYYVSIDVDKQQISLDKEIDENLETSLVRFQYINHLPVLSCKVNGQKKILGLDTGSASNYLFSFDSKSVDNLATSASPVLVVGTGNLEDIRHRVLLNLQVPEGGMPVPSSFIVDVHGKNQFQSIALDGILGQEFLHDYNIIIHPGKQKMLLMPAGSSDVVIE